MKAEDKQRLLHIRKLDMLAAITKFGALPVAQA
jgi:hypothetical protein